MKRLEKRQYYNILFDFYENLLTDKQREYFSCYYFKDLSLQEIANCFDISRNAVYDQLNVTYGHLERFEKKLGLYRKYKERDKLYEEYSGLNNPEVMALIKKLKDLE